MDFQRTNQPGDNRPTRAIEVLRYGSESTPSRVMADDVVAVEEPLEIRLGYTFLGKPAERSISVTMRTPGHDRELASGFLFGEGIISHASDIARYEPVVDCGDAPSTNIMRLVVGPDVAVDMRALQRNFYTTSSCGVCGKASLEALSLDHCAALTTGNFTVAPELIGGLPEALRAAQHVFEDTGGIHAAGLFDEYGHLIAAREDVGRHNAMDKLVGSRLLAGELPATRTIAVLSGRASFELLQKALRAQIPIVVAVGAPSSLAVDLASAFGITLVGFARNGRFNVYTHGERIE